MKEVLGYIRKSRKWQHYENQTAEIEDECKVWEYTNPLLYTDVCPKYQLPCYREHMPELIEKLLKGKCILFVRALDRIGSTIIIIYFVREYIMKPGNRLITLEDGEVNLKDWEGFRQLVFSKSIEEIDAEREHKTRTGRQRENDRRVNNVDYATEREMEFHRSIVINRPNFGVTWYWYRNMFISTGHSQWVAEVFDMYLFDHWGSDRIAQFFIKKGIKTSTGADFSANAVLSVLKNRAYMTGIKRDKYGQEYRYEDKLIDEYRFMRARKRMWMFSSTGGKLGGMIGGLFSGILWCGKCNRRMNKVKDRYRCKICKMKVVEHELLKVVKQKIMEDVNEKLYRGRYNIMLHAHTIKKRLFDVNDIDWKRLIRNWIPIELDKKIIVSGDRVGLDSLTLRELDELLCVRDGNGDSGSVRQCIDDNGAMVMCE
jgi:hypothetical protein